MATLYARSYQPSDSDVPSRPCLQSPTPSSHPANNDQRFLDLVRGLAAQVGTPTQASAAQTINMSCSPPDFTFLFSISRPPPGPHPHNPSLIFPPPFQSNLNLRWSQRDPYSAGPPIPRRAWSQTATRSVLSRAPFFPLETASTTPPRGVPRISTEYTDFGDVFIAPGTVSTNLPSSVPQNTAECVEFGGCSVPFRTASTISPSSVTQIPTEWINPVALPVPPRVASSSPRSSEPQISPEYTMSGALPAPSTNTSVNSPPLTRRGVLTSDASLSESAFRGYKEEGETIGEIKPAEPDLPKAAIALYNVITALDKSYRDPNPRTGSNESDDDNKTAAWARKWTRACANDPALDIEDYVAWVQKNDANKRYAWQAFSAYKSPAFAARWQSAIRSQTASAESSDSLRTSS